MSSKRCFKCQQELALEEFYRHPRMKDGRLNKCIECAKRDVTANRLEKLSYYRIYDKQRAFLPHRIEARRAYMQTQKGKAAHAAALRRQQIRFPKKAKARQIVRNAVRDGAIARQPCIKCGAKAEAHHPDYDRPLDVVWLCPQHHKAAHAAMEG
jgi:hypothetical protein